ncbi:MAG: 50S ribosomal protein L4 [Lachnospiraceae bacterium]|nr:50S ribosomal protein L4 [Lachnospiraceae bacterium]
MAKVSLYNTEGSQVGEIELNDAVFGVEVNENIMHKAVVAHLAAMRQGTQSAKTRSDVSGGGKKPWRQKGTGHARQGSIRAPQWKGGGIVFAPKPRDYDVKINKKEKQLALKSALTSKVNEGKIVVLDSFELDEIKTKKFAQVMKNLNVSKAFVVLGEKNENVEKSAANIQGIKTSTTNTISTYDILKYDSLVLTQDAVNRITEVYA